MSELVFYSKEEIKELKSIGVPLCTIVRHAVFPGYFICDRCGCDNIPENYIYHDLLNDMKLPIDLPGKPTPAKREGESLRCYDCGAVITRIREN